MAMPSSVKRRPEFRSVRTVAELAEILRASKRPLRLGGDMQFFERPEWRRVKEVYRLEDDWFRTVPMDPTRMYDAVVDGQVEAIVAYSSDGRIPTSSRTRPAPSPSTTPCCWSPGGRPRIRNWPRVCNNWSVRSPSRTCRRPTARSTSRSGRRARRRNGSDSQAVDGASSKRRQAVAEDLVHPHG
jgi:hypothetical protein